MKIWKLFSILALSVLLVAMLAACEGGSSGDTTQSGGQGNGVATSTLTADSTASAPTTAAPTSAPTTAAPTSAPTTAAPTSAPSTGGSQSTGSCTTAASCQKAIVNVIPNHVKPGGKVTITGKGWVANAKLQASIGVQAVESDIVYATSDAQGNFSVTLTIDPRTADIGPTTIHINLADTTDGSKNLRVDNQLVIIG